MPLEMLFDNPDAAEIGTPELLEHDLNRYFPELLKFNSTAELARSSTVEKVREDSERILNAVLTGSRRWPGTSNGGSCSMGSRMLFKTIPI